MKKFIKVISIATLSLGIMTGCIATTTEDKAELTETMSITHDLGEITVPSKPQKIVVFDAGILDSISELGTEAELAFPVNSLPSYLEQYSNLTNVGSFKEPDMEAIYEFAPDLIIISGRQESFYEQLSDIAPTWYAATDYADPIGSFKSNTTTLAKLIGKEDLATEKMNALDVKINDVATKGSSLDKKALILLTNDGTISAYGNGSRFGFIHDTLNIPMADENVGASTHGQEVGYEYISQINPDILFIVDRTQVVAGTVDSSTTLDNDLVKSTKAAQENQMYNLNPEYWYISGMGLYSLEQMINEISVIFDNK